MGGATLAAVAGGKVGLAGRGRAVYPFASSIEGKRTVATLAALPLVGPLVLGSLLRVAPAVVRIRSRCRRTSAWPLLAIPGADRRRTLQAGRR